jgi:hypothetical protein
MSSDKELKESPRVSRQLDSLNDDEAEYYG